MTWADSKRGGGSAAAAAAGTVGGLIGLGTARLAAVGGTGARLEAQLLLGYATGRARPELLAHPEAPVGEVEETAFLGLLARRAAAEPIAYLLGEREFYGRTFKVDRRALIPRPETELLVDLGKSAVARWRGVGVEPNVVDVGTGCGAIAISVAAEARVRVVATDVSGPALALARENASQHSLSTGVSLVQTNLLAGLRGPLHVVLANLPYVPRDRDLPPDVKDYEPALAIFGGQRGTELIERFLREARRLLAPAAELAVELDEEAQAAPVAALARQLYPGAQVEICQDAGGYDRVVQLRLA
jgi:release factor glutamine methyltransferase